MESKIIVSRSVVVNSLLKKTQAQSYQKHKIRLDEIRRRRSSVNPNEFQSLRSRKQSVKQAVAKVQGEFDAHLGNKKSLVDHIRTILSRKGESFKQIKMYKNSCVEKEKREIERQTKLLYDKIEKHKRYKMKKQQLKKQFAAYESQKNLLRKVKYESQKPQRRRHKSQSSQQIHRE